ncbi:MAG: MBL fold metallo-hydrolase [Hyphomonas sp.]|nr:MBL fold metallo-hydrolase [Hyphomonas sp.]
MTIRTRLACGLAALLAAAACKGPEAPTPVPEAERTSGSPAAIVEYIANEGILVMQGETKLMFDPVFTHSYAQYRMPSLAQRQAMFAGTPPFDGVDVVFVSHIHADHFTASDMNDYLAAQPGARLVAPAQVVEELVAAANWSDASLARITSLTEGMGDPARQFTLDGGIGVTAVSLPHSGWPDDWVAGITNMVYRVSTGAGASVIHMGDASGEAGLYTPYDAVWQAERTDTAFPPFWLLAEEAGRSLVLDTLNADRAIGIHVPVAVPDALIAASHEHGFDYLSEPGEQRTISAGGAD